MSELKKPILKNQIKKNFEKLEIQCQNQNAASEQKTSSNKLKFVSKKT